MNQYLTTSDFDISVIILSTVIIYYFYYYFISSGMIEKYCNKMVGNVQKEISKFFIKKVLGFLILGLIPLLLYNLLMNPDFGKFGISFIHFRNNFLIIFILIIVIAVVLFINQKTNNKHNSLQINLSEWNILLFMFNAAGWIIYLVGYELLFRGILLFECFNSFGFWPAIAINAAVYSAIHLVNGKDQTIGALIFGIVACYLTLIRGSVLIPIFMHISLSILSDYFSIWYNNDLGFIRQKSFNFPKI